MRILLFGATGGTGRQVTAQALARGHEITAFVRHPQAWPERDPRVRLVAGDAASGEPKVEAALEGQDAVVSALGRRASFRSDRLMERSMGAIVPAMERRGVRRLVVVSAFGVGESRREAPPIPRFMYRLLLGEIFADVAHFIVKELESPAFVRKTVALAG